MRDKRGLHEYWSALRKQRLPFLPLLAAGVAGILLGGELSIGSAVWLGIAGVGLVGFLGSALRPSRVLAVGFYVFVAATFAGLHLWQGRESPAAIIAKSLPEEGRIAEVRGVVGSEPDESRDGRRGFFTLKVESLRVGEKWLPVNLDARVIWPGKQPHYGDGVKIRGVLQNLALPRNPGEFSYAQWLERQGVYSQIRVSHEQDGAVISSGGGNPLMRMAIAARQWMREVITRDLDPKSPEAQLIVAMTLGETGPISPVILDQFRDTGTYHLFSVSGLHVGMVATLLWLLLRACRVPTKVVVAIIIPALFFYALITGWKPPSVRAAVMGAFVFGGFLVDRPVVVLNNLCAAAFFILLGNTNEIFNVGFQLSFLVVATLILLVPPLQKVLETPLRCDEFLPRRLYHAGDRVRNYLAIKFSALTAVSAAAWVGSVALILGSFHMISFSAVPANLVSVPLSFAIMFAAMISLCFGVVAPWLVGIVNNANWLVAKGMLVTVQVFASLPGSSVGVGVPEISREAATMVVFDCGAGGAVSLEVGSRYWLIDTGPVGFPDRILIPYLRERGAMQLAGVIFSHGDARHIGGGMEMIDRVPVARFLLPSATDQSSTRRKLLNTLRERGFALEAVQAGDRIEVAPGIVGEILYPPVESERSVADDKALVILWRIGGRRVMMISDAGLFTEMWLLDHARESLRADVLIKGNHSRGIGLQGQFLDAVRPQVVISTAADHPDTERVSPALEAMLKERGVRFFRQDETGAVTLRFFKDRVEVNGFLDGSRYSLPSQSSISHEPP